MNYNYPIRRITLKNIPYKELVLIPSYSDGSCYFHSILQAFSTDYLNLKNYDEKNIFIKNVRSKLSEHLFVIDSNGKTIYENLSNGLLKELSSENKTVSLEYMEKELKSNNPVNEIYQELISNVFDIDIYIIDTHTEDVYMLGAPYENLYKNRNSIFISYQRPFLGEIGHYETLGIIRNGKVDTFFETNDEFTLLVKKRFDVKKK